MPFVKYHHYPLWAAVRVVGTSTASASEITMRSANSLETTACGKAVEDGTRDLRGYQRIKARKKPSRKFWTGIWFAMEKRCHILCAFRLSWLMLRVERIRVKLEVGKMQPEKGRKNRWEDIVSCCPPGITSDAGVKKGWFKEDNRVWWAQRSDNGKAEPVANAEKLMFGPA